MKKNQIIVIGLFSIVLLIASGFTLKSVPEFTSFQEDIDVENFTSVAIAIPASTTIEIGNKHSLSIDADEKNMENIEVEVKDGRLIIKAKNKSKRIKGDVYIHIVAPDFEGLAIAGSGDIMAKKSFYVDDLELKIAGSGDMKFADLKTDDLQIKISGSGDVVLNGKGSEVLSISIAGSGDLTALDFEVGEFEARISGSGGCKVSVSDKLNVSIAGSGSVKYKGSPEVNSKVAGSGSISKMN